MLKRNLLYTEVTQGKKHIILIGQEKAVALAIKEKKAQMRWSKLKEWLI